jgi:23S rRNA-/tRNA-specific pseudouridylate synthase
MHATLRQAFGAGRVVKTYLAIVDGRPVSRECDAPLVQRGKKVAIDHTDGLAAYTAFQVVDATATHALVRCSAHTGRMHQVRVHLATVGSPITGDTLYGGSAHPDGFFLHAASIALPDLPPIEAPIPDGFAATVAALGLKA